MSKNVRIIANANNKNLKTANIITSGTTTRPTQAQGAADDRRFATVQDSGGTVKGLPTIIVPGYSAGGGGGYVAKAVHFDGSAAQLGINALTSIDNHFFSIVAWTKQSQTNNLLTFDPNNNYQPNLGSLGQITGYYQPQAAVTDASGVNYEIMNTAYNADAGEGAFDNDVWACQIISVDTSGDFRVGKIYNGDTDVTDTTPPAWAVHGTSPFVIATNGLSLFVGSDSQGDWFLGDVADIRILPGISLLTDGDIPLATRRLFIDANGKPVDPAVATAALGAPGAVLFSGDASTFATNQGTGGAFTLTGSLTNATTSPSD